jgi:hypothetical protein
VLWYGLRAYKQYRGVKCIQHGLRTSSERAAAADVLASATLLSMSATVSTDDTVPFSAVVKLSSPLRLRCAGAAPWRAVSAVNQHKMRTELDVVGVSYNTF